MHRTLARQLQRQCGIDSDEGMRKLIDAAQDLAAQPGIAPELASFLGGLKGLVSRVDRTYEQYDGDIRLHTHSLELSSAELSQANERLRAELASRDRMLQWVRQAVGSLLPHAEVAPKIPLDGDVEGLSALLPHLVWMQESRRIEYQLMAEQNARSERRYRMLVNSLKEVVFRMSKDGCWTFLNPAWTEVTGFTIEESLGRPFLEFVHADDLEQTRERFRQFAAKKAAAGNLGMSYAARYEVRYRTRDFGYRWIGVFIRREVDEDGNTVDLAGTLDDVTRQREAAEKIKESLSFVDALFDSVPVPVFLKDRKGRFERVNKAFREFYDIDEQEILGKTSHDVLDPDAADVHQDYERRARESGITQTYESSFRLSTGQQYDLLVSKVALPRGDGVIGAAVDISTHKDAIRAMLLVKEAAESANRAKSDFLANMSHEIRTPMNSVIGMALLALKTDLNAQQRDYLVKILVSGEHLLGLINDILDFSKIEAGKLKLDTAAFDLDATLGKVIAQVVGKAAAKGLKLRCELDPGVTRHLMGDALRLSQVLINLVGNAVKFTDIGAVHVRVRALEDGESACLLQFEVEDSGIGMNAGETAHLFQPFQQADTSTTRNYGGTGLGLAISRRLVEQMGGQIGVESRAGEGSRFWFTARMEKDLSPGAPESTNAEERQHADLLACKGVRVLLVEDNAFNQQVAAEFLAAAGAEVSIAGNGQEALDRLRHVRVDCVLMDVQMPVMDGLEATRRLRADPALADLWVVAMTANASTQDKEHCLAAGMNDFLSKPVSPEKLYRAVAGLERRQPAASGEAAPAPPEPVVDAPPEPVVDAPPEVRSFAGDPDIIDLSVLAANFNNDPGKIRKFAGRFLETARQGVDDAEAALAQRDLAALAALGHRHKSSARAVGAAGLGNLWQSIEQLKESKQIVQAEQSVRRLRLLLARIETYLSQSLPSGHTG